MANHTILVIDDDLDMREVLRYVLNDIGYDMVACSNGREALDWLETHTPAIILVDLMMPVMNGREFLKEKAKIAALRPIPTLVMSASVYLEEFPDGKFLKKPFDLHMLREVLLKTLRENQ